MRKQILGWCFVLKVIRACDRLYTLCQQMHTYVCDSIFVKFENIFLASGRVHPVHIYALGSFGFSYLRVVPTFICNCINLVCHLQVVQSYTEPKRVFNIKPL